MKKRLFNYYIINLLLITVTTVSVSYPKHAYGIDANLSAKNIINKYIEGYLSNEFKDIATNDLELLRWAYKSIEDIPKSFREEELNKAINKVVHDLKDLEETKKSYGSILYYKNQFIPVFSEKRNFVYGKRFYKILYPEMKYEIMEIREESDTESLFGDDRVSEMAFVRLFYSNPKNAPYLEYHQYKEMSKVKSVIIKLYLWVSNEKEYLISHYVPTEYKRELFNRHNSKAIREREDREKLMKEQQQKVEKAQKEEQEKVEKEARKKQKVEYERKLAERKKREKKAEAQRNIEAEKRKQEEARIAALRKESEVPAKALFKFKCEIDSIGFLGYYSTMEITDTNITLFNNFRNRTKTIWFGNFDTIEKQYHRAAFGGAWQLRINRVYSIIIKDEAEIDKIYNVLTLAISQWYDKFSDVAPRKTRPVFLSKSSKVTGQKMAVLMANVSAATDNQKLLNQNINLLEQHAQETAANYCAGCASICESEITNEVPISDVMRYLMYSRCYGEPERAKSAFTRMPSKVRKILVDMDYKKKERKCPQRMQIGRLMREAAAELA